MRGTPAIEPQTEQTKRWLLCALFQYLHGDLILSPLLESPKDGNFLTLALNI